MGNKACSTKQAAMRPKDAMVFDSRGNRQMNRQICRKYAASMYAWSVVRGNKKVVEQ